MTKLKIFKNSANKIYYPLRGYYYEHISAADLAQDFINNNKIEVKDIQYQGGEEDKILLIYEANNDTLDR
jgi:hypothetical protein